MKICIHTYLHPILYLWRKYTIFNSRTCSVKSGVYNDLKNLRLAQYVSDIWVTISPQLEQDVSDTQSYCFQRYTLHMVILQNRHNIYKINGSSCLHKLHHIYQICLYSCLYNWYNMYHECSYQFSKLNTPNLIFITGIRCIIYTVIL